MLEYYSKMRVPSIAKTALEQFGTKQIELLHVCSFGQPIQFDFSEVRKGECSDVSTALHSFPHLKLSKQTHYCCISHHSSEICWDVHGTKEFWIVHLALGSPKHRNSTWTAFTLPFTSYYAHRSRLQLWDISNYSRVMN